MPRPCRLEADDQGDHLPHSQVENSRVVDAHAMLAARARAPGPNPLAMPTVHGGRERGDGDLARWAAESEGLAGTNGPSRVNNDRHKHLTRRRASSRIHLGRRKRMPLSLDAGPLTPETACARTGNRWYLPTPWSYRRSSFCSEIECRTMGATERQHRQTQTGAHDATVDSHSIQKRAARTVEVDEAVNVILPKANSALLPRGFVIPRGPR
jgi:hypothetical protein